MIFANSTLNHVNNSKTKLEVKFLTKFDTSSLRHNSNLNCKAVEWRWIIRNRGGRVQECGMGEVQTCGNVEEVEFSTLQSCWSLGYSQVEFDR